MDTKAYEDNTEGPKHNIGGYEDTTVGYEDSTGGYEDNTRGYEDNTEECKDLGWLGLVKGCLGPVLVCPGGPGRLQEVPRTPSRSSRRLS